MGQKEMTKHEFSFSLAIMAMLVAMTVAVTTAPSTSNPFICYICGSATATVTNPNVVLTPPFFPVGNITCLLALQTGQAGLLLNCEGFKAVAAANCGCVEPSATTTAPVSAMGTTAPGVPTQDLPLPPAAVPTTPSTGSGGTTGSAPVVTKVTASSTPLHSVVKAQKNCGTPKKSARQHKKKSFSSIRDPGHAPTAKKQPSARTPKGSKKGTKEGAIRALRSM